VAQLGKIEGSRHIAGWLPWFALIVGVGLDFATSFVRSRYREVARAAVALVVVAILLRPVAYFAAAVDNHTIYKVPAQRLVDRWIARHIHQDDPVLVACCTSADAATVANWMRQNGDEVPRPRNSVIWFGDRTSLNRIGRGYIVVDEREYGPAYIAYYGHSDPSQVVDPFHNRGFRLAARFPWGVSAIDVFRFDLVQHSAHGVHVLAATYAPPGWKRLRGNQTTAVAASCDGRSSCTVVVAFGPEGDPAPEVAKAFVVSWTCGGDRRRRVATVAPEALGKSVLISCSRR
jgi:hypothetical protein